MRSPHLDLTAWIAVLSLILATTGTAIIVSVRRQPVGRAQAGTRETWVQSAEAAHAAAGIATSSLGGAQTRFHQDVEVLQARLRSEPENAELELSLARLLHDGHRIPEAVAHYRAAIRLAPMEGQAYYDLAAAHGSLGEWTEAGAVLRERLAVAPDDAVAMYDLGATLANVGEFDAARMFWSRVLTMPGNEDIKTRSRVALGRIGARGPP